jgi:integration host factor subunit beta
LEENPTVYYSSPEEERWWEDVFSADRKAFPHLAAGLAAMNGRPRCSISEEVPHIDSDSFLGREGDVMTKRDLIDEVNKRFPHLSRRDSEVIINAIFDSMVDALAQGDRIEIRGFGSFVVKHRRARQGRNPKSGVLVSVAAKRVPFFKVGKELRLRVDGKDPGTEEASE